MDRYVQYRILFSQSIVISGVKQPPAQAYVKFKDMPYDLLVHL